MTTTTKVTTTTVAEEEEAAGTTSRNASSRRGRLEREAAGVYLGDLFAEHGRMVLGLCRLLLRDPVEAEDAAQQVFLSAHQSLLRGSLPREPAPWLAAISRNECRARVRARMREPLALPELPSDLPDPLAAAIRAADLQAVWSALGSLPRRQRRALVLRELGGLSYHELGRALGMSHSAVESLLFRARQRVGSLLAGVNARAATVPFVWKVAAGALGVGVVATGAGGLHPLRTPPQPAPQAEVPARVTSAGPRFVPRMVAARDVLSPRIVHPGRREHVGHSAPQRRQPAEAIEPVEPVARAHEQPSEGPAPAPAAGEPAQLESAHEGAGDGGAVSGSGDEGDGGGDASDHSGSD